MQGSGFRRQGLAVGVLVLKRGSYYWYPLIVPKMILLQYVPQNPVLVPKTPVPPEIC